MRKLKYSLLAVLALALLAFFALGPRIVDERQNPNLTPARYAATGSAKSLHGTLTIMDWHADTLLWNRNVFNRHERGHVDLPRLQDGNVAVQMFTVVSKVPRGQNYVTTADQNDVLTLLFIAQRWPPSTWVGTKARAVYQARKLDRWIAESDGAIRWIRNRPELDALLEARARAQSNGAPPPLGALLGMEGAHPLEGDFANLERFFDLGYRMIGLTHFFDNEVSGSLHGVEKGGLSELGKKAVRRMNELGIIIDIAHASEQAVREVLALSTRPVVLSHGGMRGHCNSARNLPDALMKQVAQRGGLVAIGFWSGAICDPSPDGIAGAIAYAVDTLGVEHVALGSDWDGGVSSIDADSLPALTEALLKRGLSERDVARVMGENSMAFLRRSLPDS